MTIARKRYIELPFTRLARNPLRICDGLVMMLVVPPMPPSPTSEATIPDVTSWLRVASFNPLHSAHGV